MIDKSSPLLSTREQRSKFWQSHLEIWKDSGLSQAEYCRQKQLKSRIFTYWKLKLSSQDSPVKFIQVCAESVPPIPSAPVFNNSGSPLRLTVNCRFAIDIPDGFSPATLQQVLRTLQEV
ncbi:MAG: IS66 family insertion sequence element accessory protein TnpB [Desulfamplus sp.]|nr:IS66 family insertion sequence element accessory protein TnpB [Desulfamplus sp.]